MNAPSTSHYPAAPTAQKPETHTLSVLVDNEPGVLARVIGLFSGRGYNIEVVDGVGNRAPAASFADHDRYHRHADGDRADQESTRSARSGASRGGHDACRAMPSSGSSPWSRSRARVSNRVEALRLADAFRARVIDATTESFVFEITGASDKIEQFISLMLPLGLVEVARTGIAAIMRGPEGM